MQRQTCAASCFVDSAHIQVFEAQWRNRKARRSGDALYEPIYGMEDADAAIKLLAPCDYNQKITLCEGIEIRFQDIGHLLGSASIEVWITEDGVTKKIVFSGDVGNTDQPIIKDPTPVKEADYVVIESTYGDRTHGDERPDYVSEFTRILRETFARGGNVVIPLLCRRTYPGDPVFYPGDQGEGPASGISGIRGLCGQSAGH